MASFFLNFFSFFQILNANLPRPTHFLVAAKSMRRPVIGWLAKTAGSIPVERPQDIAFAGKGLVSIQNGSSTVTGRNTLFTTELKPGDKIQLLGCEPLVVESITSSTEFVTKGNVTLESQKDCTFKILPKIDQVNVFGSATEHLLHGGTISIFPEGGSHDRTTLLPLKPGVAIMAFEAVLAGAEDITIVPVGLNYFREHGFRGKAIVTIGEPFNVTSEMAAEYDKDHRGAISSLLKRLEISMNQTILPAKDFREQLAIKLCASLLPPDRIRLPSEKRFYLCQRFARIFDELRDTPTFVKLRAKLDSYQELLRGYGVKDWEVWRLRVSLLRSLASIITHAVIAILYFVLGLPILPLWLPMWLICAKLSETHRQQALKESSVKVKATDVLTSYQIITALVLVPVANIFYAFILSIWFVDGFFSNAFTVLNLVVWVLPTLEYLSLRCLEMVPNHLNSIKVFSGAFLRSINSWRGAEREVTVARMEMQQSLRKVLKEVAHENTGNSSSKVPTALDEISEVIPWIVIDKDDTRIKKRLEEWDAVLEDDFNNDSPALRNSSFSSYTAKTSADALLQEEIL